MSSKAPKKLISLREAIRALDEQARRSDLSSRARKQLEGELHRVMAELEVLLSWLDPIQQPSAVFDPSNPKVMGSVVALALVAQARHPLGEIPSSYGSGVYAIYYAGSHAAYQPISGTETPIYVGQASPTSSSACTPRDQGARLAARLNEHRKNILRAAGTLDIADFQSRSLVVQSGWETSAEDYLIRLFRPVWNNESDLVYGLGKHGDSATTRANKRSPWDTLHPGRAWALASSADAKSIERIERELSEHYRTHPVLKSTQDVLARFLDDLRQA